MNQWTTSSNTVISFEEFQETLRTRAANILARHSYDAAKIDNSVHPYYSHYPVFCKYFPLMCDFASELFLCGLANGFVSGLWYDSVGPDAVELMIHAGVPMRVVGKQLRNAYNFDDDVESTADFIRRAVADQNASIPYISFDETYFLLKFEQDGNAIFGVAEMNSDGKCSSFGLLSRELTLAEALAAFDDILTSSIAHLRESDDMTLPRIVPLADMTDAAPGKAKNKQEWTQVVELPANAFHGTFKYGGPTTARDYYDMQKKYRGFESMAALPS